MHDFCPYACQNNAGILLLSTIAANILNSQPANCSTNYEVINIGSDDIMSDDMTSDDMTSDGHHVYSNIPLIILFTVLMHNYVL